MVNWQVTAATLRCVVIGGEVTLMVYKDWSVACTAHAKRVAGGKGGRGEGHGPGCEGTGCRLVDTYRKKLQAEEKPPAG
jgi:hypothetical protein